MGDSAKRQLSVTQGCLLPQRVNLCSMPRVQSGLTFWMRISPEPGEPLCHARAASPEEAMPTV